MRRGGAMDSNERSRRYLDLAGWRIGPSEAGCSLVPDFQPWPDDDDDDEDSRPAAQLQLCRFCCSQSLPHSLGFRPFFQQTSTLDSTPLLWIRSEFTLLTPSLPPLFHLDTLVHIHRHAHLILSSLFFSGYPFIPLLFRSSWSLFSF